METKNVIEQNGEYICDIDITVDEWKDILRDKYFENYFGTLIKFYNEPEHKSTCKALSDKYNIHSSSFVGKIKSFSQAVQKKLNRFEVNGTDNDSTYWIIPMKGRKVLGGLFEWEIRPELVQAIEELQIVKHITKYVIDFFDVTDQSIKTFSKEAGVKYDENSFGAKYYYDTRKKLQYLGGLIGDRLNVKLENNYNEKPNKMAGQGKGFVLKEYILAGFMPQNHRNVLDNNVFVKISFWGFNDLPKFGIDIDVNFSDQKNKFNSLRDIFQEQYWTIPISDFPTNWDDLLDIITPEFERLINYIDNFFKKEEKMSKIFNYVNHLRKVKNIVLTGAPGTGKTYLAKEIAKAMVAEQEFVQFHPSYDYTDFVEGLRPIKKDGAELGFELKDGVFKSFCKRAVKNLADSKKSKEELQKQKSLSDSLTFFIEKIENEIAINGQFKIYGIGGKECAPIIEIDANSFTTKAKSGNTLTTTLNGILSKYELFEKFRDISWNFKEVGEKLSVSYHHTYFFAFLKAFDNYIQEQQPEIGDVEIVNRKDFVIIIDEINRAEISKVFGELFFSIDPGYRGGDGIVKTQYSNLQDDADIFKDGFYIPENVYIIGTMNDIDRSVETFDFAMRRRFSWIEVKAIDRIEMLDSLGKELKEIAVKRMNAINKVIFHQDETGFINSIEGLNAGFHIGPAYFLKLNKDNEYKDELAQLWEFHLKPLINEYLRGLPHADQSLQDIKEAFFKDE